MTDNSKYADSAQARQLDHDLEQRFNPGTPTPHGQRQLSAEQLQANADREERNAAERKLRLMGALDKMDAFFGSTPAKRNAEGIIVSR